MLLLHAKRRRLYYLGNGPINRIRTVLISTLRLLLKFVPVTYSVHTQYVCIQREGALAHTRRVHIPVTNVNISLTCV